MVRAVLTDEQWQAMIKRLLPGKSGDLGRAAKDNRLFFEAVLWLAPSSFHREVLDHALKRAEQCFRELLFGATQCSRCTGSSPTQAVRAVET